MRLKLQEELAVKDRTKEYLFSPLEDAMSIRDGPRLDLENSRLHFRMGMT
jgi:hypothetical protein